MQPVLRVRGAATSFDSLGPTLQLLLLSLAWCDRMSYFCNLWIASGQADEFEFNDSHAEAYAEPEYVLAASRTWLTNSHEAKRLKQLRDIRPIGVGHPEAEESDGWKNPHHHHHPLYRLPQITCTFAHNLHIRR